MIDGHVGGTKWQWMGSCGDLRSAIERIPQMSKCVQHEEITNSVDPAGICLPHMEDLYICIEGLLTLAQHVAGGRNGHCACQQ